MTFVKVQRFLSGTIEQYVLNMLYITIALLERGIWSARGRVCAVRGRNYSICGEMNHKKSFFYECKETQYNFVSITDYLKKLIEFLSNENLSVCSSIINNIRFNHVDSVG